MSEPAEPPAGGPSAARRRHRRVALSVAITLAVLGTIGVVVFTRLTPTPLATAVSPTPAPATGTVTKTNLVDRIKVDGELAHGSTTPVTGRKSGTLTRLPAVATLVNRGEPLYWVNAIPVPLLLGDTPLYRDLAEGVPDGPDVKLLQQNLAAMGYREVGKADDTFDASTTKALKRWQKALKVEQTGTLAPGDVVVLPGPVRIHSVSAQLGAPAEGPLFAVTGTERLVTAELAESQRRIAKPGAKVAVELPDGRTVPGTVRDVGTKTQDTGDDKAPKLAVTIGLDDAALASAMEPGRVTVRFDGDRRDNVLAVPVQALLALREGGYALEVVEPGNRRLLPVQLGLFADGLVEVSGEGLVEGMKVVTSA